MNEVYDKNTEGRDFVIGDLHGCYDIFQDLLTELDFDTEVDRMFSVGDLIDRGDKSFECLQLIKEPWFHSVLGNHEDLMIKGLLHEDGIDLWVINGGAWHYGISLHELIPIVKLAKLLPYSITVQTGGGDVGICHAEPPSLDWKDVIDPDQRTKTEMIWGRSWVRGRSKEDVENVEGVHKTIHGHTVLKDPVEMGNVLFIDTGAVFTGKLTCKQLQ